MKLLWIGDDPSTPTGFARVAKSVLAHLSKTWDVAVLGVGGNGDPNQLPYRVYPAGVLGSPDPFGYSRFVEVLNKERPDVVLVNSDPWIAGEFAAAAEDLTNCPPIVGYVPVDAPGMKREHAKALGKLAVAIFYTQFGLDEATRAGCDGDAEVVPHGIDLSAFRQIDKATARKALGMKLPPDAFLIGNVNRNQPRKRIDLTLDYFAKWLRQRGDTAANVFLYLHMDPKDVAGDLEHMVDYFGLRGRVGLSTMSMRGRKFMADEQMSNVYSALDVQISTTLGEGWGLTTMEGMACRVIQVVPASAALGEWARGAAHLVPCTGVDNHKNYESGGIGAVVDERGFLDALDRVFDDAAYRDELAQRGLALVNEPRFRWEAIAARFDEILTEVVGRRQRLKVAS